MKNLNDLNIYLASSSPRRKAVFDFLGLKYQILKLSIEEQSDHEYPLDYCFDIVRDKLKAAKKMVINPLDHCVIVADTVVCLGKEKLGKPKDRNSALDMLVKLSGRTHKVITGVGYSINGEDRFFHDETEVEFMRLDSKMINYFLDKNTYKDKAGSYGIQSEECFFVSKVIGSFSNVIGFPLEKFREEFNL